MGYASFLEDIRGRWGSPLSIAECEQQSLKNTFNEEKKVCGICDRRVNKNQFYKHLKTHYPVQHLIRWLIQTPCRIISQRKRIEVSSEEIKDVNLIIIAPDKQDIEVSVDSKTVPIKRKGRRIQIPISKFIVASKDSRCQLKIEYSEEEINLVVRYNDKKGKPYFIGFDILNEVCGWTEIEAIFSKDTPSRIDFESFYARISSQTVKEKKTFLLGLYFYLKGMPKDAISYLIKFQGTGVADIYRALSYFQLSDYHSAVKNAESAIQDVPPDIQTLSTLIKLSSLCLMKLKFMPYLSENLISHNPIDADVYPFIIRTDDWSYVSSSLYLMMDNLEKALSLVKNDKSEKANIIRAKIYYKSDRMNSLKRECMRLINRNTYYKEETETLLNECRWRII